jgi:hypothetical protein
MPRPIGTILGAGALEEWCSRGSNGDPNTTERCATPAGESGRGAEPPGWAMADNFL